MLADSSVLAVEFETADDITVRKIDADGQVNEYIQVKTTEDDRKWSFKELTDRATKDGKKVPGSSLCEKSLACDRFPGRAEFCFVTSRDVQRNLRPFLIGRDKRTVSQEYIEELSLKFGRKYKTFSSPNGRSLEDWASSMHWRVAVSSDTQRIHSINVILRTFEARGLMPSYSRAEKIYDELLSFVREAADASRASDPMRKAVARSVLLDWWEGQKSKIISDSHVTAKVYEIKPEQFLVEFLQDGNSDLKRYMSSFDAEFDDGVWRSKELCDYLLDWLPEMTLPAKVLSHFNRFEARKLLPKAQLALKGKSISAERLLSETLLHAILRNHLDSEPIPCRLFSLDDGTATSAHIVFTNGGDQLWLGRPALLPIKDSDLILSKLFSELEFAVTSGVLKKEREFALLLREPAHARPTSLQSLLSNRAKIEDLRKVIHLPILLAFDSRHLGRGFYDDYLNDLTQEVKDKYSSLVEMLPGTLSEVSVTFFLLPVPDVASLTKHFEAALHQ